jgi:hypothetical protein
MFSLLAVIVLILTPLATLLVWYGIGAARVRTEEEYWTLATQNAIKRHQGLSDFLQQVRGHVVLDPGESTPTPDKDGLVYFADDATVGKLAGGVLQIKIKCSRKGVVEGAWVSESPIFL